MSNTRAFRHDFISGSSSGVEIYIAEGTSRQEAIDALQAALDYVKLCFNVAIHDTDKANEKAANRAAAAEKLRAEARRLGGIG